MGNASSSEEQWVEKRALIIGRAYPESSKKHIETVCTGAITESGELIRLYPISLRYLDENQQYKLWTWVSFEVRKSEGDKRKESYRMTLALELTQQEVSGYMDRILKLS